MDGSNFELFPEADLGADAKPTGGCRAPIGRRQTPRRRREVAIRPRQSSTVALIRELHQLLERQHAELIGEVQRLRSQRRNEHESLPAVLRRVTEIERHLRLTETPQAPKPSRRHPMGG